MRSVLHLANVVALVALTVDATPALARAGWQNGAQRVVQAPPPQKPPDVVEVRRRSDAAMADVSPKDAATCEGECEVDTGRRIGADAVITGEILKVGTRFKMSLKLHETHEGRLLSTTVASGRSIDELDESAQAAAKDLLTPQ